MTGFGNYQFGQRPFGLSIPKIAVKPKVFVSYHHGRDQAYYNRFTELFDDGFDIITDTSIGRLIDSDDTDYQQQVIREQHITGSSITIVLCGAETGKRRWVDWEIHMTLNKEHALMGVALPTATRNAIGNIIVPDRLHANIQSGFAHWIHWAEDAQTMKAAIDSARAKAQYTGKIRNSEPRMKRSLS